MRSEIAKLMMKKLKMLLNKNVNWFIIELAVVIGSVLAVERPGFDFLVE